MMYSFEWTGNRPGVRGPKSAAICILFFAPLNHSPPPPSPLANLKNRVNLSRQMAPSSPRDFVLNFTAEDSVAQQATPVNTPINAPPVLPSTPFTKNVVPTNAASNRQKRHPGPITATPLQAPNNITNPNSTARTVNGPDTRPTLPTPVKADILYKLLEGYNPDICEYLFNGFTCGFDLGDNSPIFSSCPRNSVSVNFSPQQARKKLHKEIQAGRMAGPFGQPPFDPFHICPIGLRPKKTPGQYRLIHDLSYPYDFSSVNYNIPQSAKQVSYSSVGKAIQLIQKLPHGAYAAKSDIENAFKLIPIKPSLYPKLGIFFEDQYYYDKTLPQGCASSCRIFETFTTAVQWILEQRIPNILCTHYIDDFIFFADTAESCNQHLSAFLKLCSELGVPIAPDKTTVPSTTITFLGIDLDLTTHLASLPDDKLQENIQLLTHTLSTSSIRKKSLDSLLGKLCFSTSVVPGRAFLRRLYSSASGISAPSHFIKITKSMRADMHMWLAFLNSYNGVTFFRHNRIIPSNEINMQSDASHKGFGATYGTQWIQARWPKQWLRRHITVLEFFPIFVLISMFSHLLKNANILFHCDNSAVVEIINKQTSKNKYVMKILRPLVLTLMRENISLRCQHVPGIQNVLCDKISRFQVDQSLLLQYGMQTQPAVIPNHLQPPNFIGEWINCWNNV